MTLTDPYTTVGSFVLAQLKDSVPVRNAIQHYKKNIKGFDEDQVPVQNNPTGTDLPEVLQLVNSSSVRIVSASNMVTVIESFRLEINTGSYNTTKMLNPLRWAIVCALVSANFSKAGEDLSWNGDNFLQELDITNIDAGISDVLENRGIDGWTAILSLDVTMNFTRNTMIAFNAGVSP